MIYKILSYHILIRYNKGRKYVYLHHTSKVFTTKIILCFQVQVPEFACTNWIIFRVELIKSMKCLAILK